MNLKGFISITGKPGLYKVVGQGKEKLIVESLADGKRMPAFASQKISALDDITMYTTEDDVPLSEVVKKIFEKENGGACINSNEEASKLHAYFAEVLPTYDKERVYNSDLKKLFSWYNILQGNGTLAKIAAEKDAPSETEISEDKSEKNESGDVKPAKKTAAKTGEKKAAKPAKAAQPKLKADVKSKGAGAARKINAPKRGA
jgi:hypothetical protein